MSGNRAFIDTNVLAYLYSTEEPEKKDICIDALGKHTRIISTQTLNELSNFLFKKQGLTSAQVRVYIQNVEQFAEVLHIDIAIIESAITLKGRYGYSYYDSLMIASALDSDCDILISEDMSDGQLIEERLRIINPFSKS